MPQATLVMFQDGKKHAPLDAWLSGLESKPRKSAEHRAYVKCLALVRILAAQGYEMRRPLADTLRDGIYELRARIGKVNYRILYSFCGKNAVVLTHGLTKEDEVPDDEIDAAIAMRDLVLSNPGKYSVTWKRK